MLQPTAATASASPLPPEKMKALMAERMRGEFREMPGLSLTLPQACRLWSLDASVCHEALNQLVEAGYLCRKPDGAYARATDLAARPLRMVRAALDYVEITTPVRAVAQG